MNTWLEDIILSLKEIGGEGTLKDIYSGVDKRRNEKHKTWRNTIRKEIYNHSSDSDAFKGNDIFYSVNGKGEGIWGLRDSISKSEVDLSEDDIGFPEGKLKARLHIKKERNPRVIRLAKDIFASEHNGELSCTVCGFNFKENYGKIGEGFIEGHHTIAISQLSEETITKVDDIALVCSNCHRMLHRRRPWLTIDQLSYLKKK